MWWYTFITILAGLCLLLTACIQKCEPDFYLLSGEMFLPEMPLHGWLVFLLNLKSQLVSLSLQCPCCEFEQTEDARLQNGARTQNAADLRQRLNYNLGSTGHNRGYPVAITTNGDVVGMSDLHGNGVPMVRREAQGMLPSPQKSAGKMNGLCNCFCWI